VATYDDTIAWLQRLEVSGGWDLKLERMQAALALRMHSYYRTVLELDRTALKQPVSRFLNIG